MTGGCELERLKSSESSDSPVVKMALSVSNSFCSSSVFTPDYCSSTSSPISTFFLPSARCKVTTSSFTPGAISSSCLGYISRHSALRNPKSSFKTSFQIGKGRMSQICANDLKNVAGTDVEDIEAFSGCKDEIVKVAHKLADAARVITLKYFRSKLFQIIDKADQSKFSPPHSNACQLNGEEFLTWVSLCRSLLNSFVA